jgi:hypothetical protein
MHNQIQYSDRNQVEGLAPGVGPLARLDATNVDVHYYSSNNRFEGAVSEAKAIAERS